MPIEDGENQQLVHEKITDKTILVRQMLKEQRSIKQLILYNKSVAGLFIIHFFPQNKKFFPFFPLYTRQNLEKNTEIASSMPIGRGRGRNTRSMMPQEKNYSNTRFTDNYYTRTSLV